MTKDTHSNIPHMFDHWANPVVNLLVLNSFMAKGEAAAKTPQFQYRDGLRRVEKYF